MNDEKEIFLIVPSDAPDNPYPYVVRATELMAREIATSGNWGPWRVFRLQSEELSIYREST